MRWKLPSFAVLAGASVVKRARSIPLALLLLILALSSVRGGSGAPALYLPLVLHQNGASALPRVLIVAFLPDGLARNDSDEAFALQNTGQHPLNLEGWRVTDGEGTIVLPNLPLAPGQMIWCARQAQAFRVQWALAPACEYDGDTDPATPDAAGSAPRLGNTGDDLALLRPDGRIADSLAFGDATAPSGWNGPALTFYQRNPRFARAGPLFYRLFDPATLLPYADTDAAADWAQGAPDPAAGRRAAYAGWDIWSFAQAHHITWTSPPRMRLLIAPDHMLAGLHALFNTAQTSILIEAYELTHPDLTAALVARGQAGVRVDILLEGAPTGGLTDESRWAAQQIVQAGGRVSFMVSDGPADSSDRYPYLHAKFAVIDSRTLLVSTENFKTSSAPPDAGDGETSGRRGYALVIEDPLLAAHAASIFAADADPAHPDILPWQAAHPVYGAPPPGFQPPIAPNLAGYAIRFPHPFVAADAAAAWLFTAPETSLTPGPLLDLVAQAGPGDLLLAQQLYEHPFWGGSDATPASDPNPRLTALLAAARRGATVRLLLDAFFDTAGDPRSNVAAAVYLNGIAQAEGLDLQARLGNPAGEGLHAKLHLLALGPERWVVVGSLNGGEVSNKLNREMALAVASPSAFDALADVFWTDWAEAAK